MSVYAGLPRELWPAEDDRLSGRYCEALQAFSNWLGRRLEDRVPGTPVTPEELVVGERIADMATLCARFAAARAMLQGILVEARRTDNHAAAFYIATKLALLALDAGDVDDACARLRDVKCFDVMPKELDELARWSAGVDRIPVGDPGRAIFLPMALLAFGRWCAAEGEYCRAIILLQRALAVCRGNSLALSIRLAWAAASIERGEFEEAEQQLLQAGNGLDSVRAPGRYAEWLTLSAKLDIIRGRFGEVVSRLCAVVKHCDQAGFRSAAVAARLNEAYVRICLNQLSEAGDALEAAGASMAPASPQFGRLGALRMMLGARSSALTGSVAPSVFVLWSGGDSGASPSSIGPVPPDPPPAASFLDLFDDKLLLYQWELAAGNRETAAERLAQLRTVFGDCDSELIQTRLAAVEAVAAYDFGRVAEAAGALPAVCERLEQLGMLPELWHVVRTQGWCAERLKTGGQFDARLEEIGAAIAGTLPAPEAALWWANKWTVNERLLTGRFEAVRQADVPHWWPKPWRRWRALGRWHDFLVHVDEDRRQLARRESADGIAEAPQSPSLARSLLGRSPREAVLGFLVLPDRTLVSLSRFGSIRVVESRLTRLKVRLLVARWYRGLHEHGGLSDEVADELSKELGLADLLADLPQRGCRLAIVPDDALHGFPFAAIRLDNRYLIERFALTISYDRTELGRRPRRRDPRSSALVFAVTRSIDAKPPLYKAGLEAIVVARRLDRRRIAATPILDTLSREQALRAWPSSALVHAACHGRFEPDDRDATGLVLSPATGVKECLSLRDFARMDLTRVRHITLSSCWGADNYAKPNRWVVSLPETLCRRGAESVLSNLWPVYDDAGLVFAEMFYEAIARLPRAEALREVQCRFLRRDFDNTLQRLSNEAKATVAELRLRPDDPHYWAGYRLHGNSGWLLV